MASITSLTTLERDTFFTRIFCAINKIWLTKNKEKERKGNKQAEQILASGISVNQSESTAFHPIPPWSRNLPDHDPYHQGLHIAGIQPVRMSL